MRSRRRKSDKPPAELRCVLDSGGLSALLGRSQRASEWLRWILNHAGRIVVPTPVLVECITGNVQRDAELNRILGVLADAMAATVAPDESIARKAGSLRFRAQTDDGIDALVAATAVGSDGRSVVLTSDAADLEKLLVDHPHVVVCRV